MSPFPSPIFELSPLCPGDRLRRPPNRSRDARTAVDGPRIPWVRGCEDGPNPFIRLGTGTSRPTARNVVERNRNVIDGKPIVIDGKPIVIDGNADVIERSANVIDGNGHVIDGTSVVIERNADAIERNADAIDGKPNRAAECGGRSLGSR